MRWVILIFVLSAVAGAGTAYILETEALSGDAVAKSDSPTHAKVHDRVNTEFDYPRLNSQFVIPVVSDSRVRSLVALSLSLEVRKGSSEQIFAKEPKLRDAFLRVLFDHANSGGFSGEFTASGNLAALRRSLAEAGRSVIGDGLNDVLITDIARQDS